MENDKQLYLTAYDNETDESSGYMFPDGCLLWIESHINHFPCTNIEDTEDRFVISYAYLSDAEYNDIEEAD